MSDIVLGSASCCPHVEDQQSSSHYKFFSACGLVKCCYIGACVKCDPTAVSVSRESENKSKVSEARIGIELSEGNKCVERSVSAFQKRKHQPVQSSKYREYRVQQVTSIVRE